MWHIIFQHFVINFRCCAMVLFRLCCQRDPGLVKIYTGGVWLLKPGLHMEAIPPPSEFFNLLASRSDISTSPSFPAPSPSLVCSSRTLAPSPSTVSFSRLIKYQKLYHPPQSPSGPKSFLDPKLKFAAGQLGHIIVQGNAC